MNEDKKFPVDVKQFAEVLGCEESTAYGFLRLLKEIGVVETGKRPQPNGRKGKPATLYMLDAQVGERLAAFLAPKIAKLQPVELPAPVAAVQAPPVQAEVDATTTEPVTTEATLVNTADGVLVQPVDTSAGVVIE